MAKINGGATLWARQTIDSDIFYNKPDKWFKIWFYLVNQVNHKDNKRFKRGSCFLKYDWIMDKTGATYSQVKHCLEYLKSARQIATQKKTRGMLITVINYDLYQTINNYYYEKSHTKRKMKGKQKENRSHTINKNDNNEEKEDIKEIVKVRKIISASLDKKPEEKIKENDPLEFNFKDKCWDGLYDWRIKKYQGAFPMLTINYLFNDLYKIKFLSDPKKYKKMIKEKYDGNIGKMIWAWLMQERIIYMRKQKLRG